MLRLLTLAFVIFGFMGFSPSHASTLEKVRTVGVVTCGVDEHNFGFAHLNTQGHWVGFEVDYCRALAVAIFGDKEKVRFTPLNAQNRFKALSEGEIDVLLRSTTWTYKRDSALGFDYPGVTFYDQLGVLAYKNLNEKKFENVDGETICVASGTTTFETIQDYIRTSKKNLKIKTFNSRQGLNDFFFSEQCKLYAADQSALYTILATLAPDSDKFTFLEANLSKEPLGPVVRNDDAQWFDLVKWTVYGLIEAEERGLTSENIGKISADTSAALRFMLGIDTGVGNPFGLRDAWLRNVISQIGNYGEIFERHLGAQSKLKMKRGLNALWKDGGLMYAMPIR
jgi:general L-amino acid transport system substrate-binding protein